MQYRILCLFIESIFHFPKKQVIITLPPVIYVIQFAILKHFPLEETYTYKFDQAFSSSKFFTCPWLVKLSTFFVNKSDNLINY